MVRESLVSDGVLVSVVLASVVLVGGLLAKVLPALRFWSMVSVQVVAEPEQDPDQPENTDPPAGVAVKVTAVPLG